MFALESNKRSVFFVIVKIEFIWSKIISLGLYYMKFNINTIQNWLKSKLVHDV